MDAEQLDEYLEGVVQEIQSAREDPNNWKLNQEYHSQIGLEEKE